MNSRRRAWGYRVWLVLALVCSLMLAIPGAVGAQETETLQDRIVASVLEDGYWDDSSSLDASAMESVVATYGDQFAFAYTDESYEVAEEPARSAAALLALSTLDQLGFVDGPRTLLFVTSDDATGASTAFPFANLVEGLNEFDRANPESSFDQAAAEIASWGSEITPDLTVAPVAQAGDASFFDGTLPFVILGAITGGLGALALGSSKKKKSRKVHTAPARDSTASEIQEMSDLILDLDPRVTIENDPDLKARFVDASDTYRDVLERFQAATTGHELADLRIDISKARWKLDVIDAELEGKEPPAEPFTRDVSGSAWDSTRGDGVSG